jgi:hypothetical protein
MRSLGLSRLNCGERRGQQCGNQECLIKLFHIISTFSRDCRTPIVEERSSFAMIQTLQFVTNSARRYAVSSWFPRISIRRVLSCLYKK